MMKMDQQSQGSTSGSYTANLLGNIKSHLAGLQGFDVMALELIQNADDAQAKEIIFDITTEGLRVTNNRQFTYCGDLKTSLCPFLAKNGYGCDYHRIIDVGSGGKLSDSENIGRFGIGFVSTYQVTDHPEIHSSGIKLSLYPELGQWKYEQAEQATGTSFFLPWATNPDSQVRLDLAISHITHAHIEQLSQDFQKILRNSLLFLKHIKRAEVRQDGNLLLACDLDRNDDDSLVVSFRPAGNIERWHILQTDVAEQKKKLYSNYPHLENLGRSTKVHIGIRLDTDLLGEGLLYAFLPTEQPSGLPLHINADFFPESDRKAVIFAGHQHEQAWNEMLIAAAATKLAQSPEALLKIVGHAKLWQILSSAYKLYKSEEHPNCYSVFWDYFKEMAPQSKIVLAQDETYQRPGEVFFPKISLDRLEAKVLLEIGGRCVADELRSYQNVMYQMDTPTLTYDRLINLMVQTLKPEESRKSKVSQERLEQFYKPLWKIVNELLPENPIFDSPSIKKLLEIPFIFTENMCLVTINQSYVVPESINAGIVASILPELAIASQYIHGFIGLKNLTDQLELEDIVSHFQSSIRSSQKREEISFEKENLKNLYSLFADLDKFSSENQNQTTYQDLCDLPIWLSNRGLVKASNAHLPGNFHDPIGVSNLLDTSIFTPSAQEFIQSKLEVPTQSIGAFVQTFLPEFFNDCGPADESKYVSLISELARHPSLVDDEKLKQLLGSFSMIPTQDGCWSQASNTYWKTEDLVKVLGNASHLWIDPTRVPNIPSVHTFISNLGVLQKPTAMHLVKRVVSISEQMKPTEEAKRASSEAFYMLCDYYDGHREETFYKNGIKYLESSNCFPVVGDSENWYYAEELYAPYRAKGFDSQAAILDFRNMKRLKSELLGKIGISISAETQLVVDHLLYCVESNIEPHNFTYDILNERSEDESTLLAQQLSRSPCIYVKKIKRFVRPNQIYWTPQQLGQYAFTIPEGLTTHRHLFSAIGVKDAPEAKDLVDILLDIVGEYFEQSKPISDVDLVVYESCLSNIASAYELVQLDADDLRRLQEAPSILNLKYQFTHPDEVLFRDSEWHTSFFNGELDQALCNPSPELWSFLEAVGVKKLSECTNITLDFFDGEASDESNVSNALVEKADLLARLLHDKISHIKHKIHEALNKLKTVSYVIIKIQANVNRGELQVTAPSLSAQAFYDLNNHRLFLSRPVNDRSWTHILAALFHQLMPEESGLDISKLTLIVRPLMLMSVEEAHSELTDAGIPQLEQSRFANKEDLTSPYIDDMSEVAETEDEPIDFNGRIITDDQESPTKKCESVSDGQAMTGSTKADSSKHGDLPTSNDSGTLALPRKDEIEKGSVPSAEKEQVPGLSETSSYFPFHKDSVQKKKRPKHKKQWDRRLLSYVRNNQAIYDEEGGGNTNSEHNLAVEAVARDAVCAYEKKRGRIPEQMPQTHPGHDIESVDPLTGEERLIEVKGISGEWNKTGVGLSRLQFSNAQDYGNSYWLYVVELVSDPENLRVYPICSPASLVSAFMFDGAWRDAVSEEPADPSLAFIIGARVKHDNFGLGRIVKMDLRGTTRVMRIEFDQIGEKTVSLNLRVMEVMEGDHDVDDT